MTGQNGVNTFAEDIARLSVQTSQWQGIEVAKKLLVFFVKGALKGKLMELRQVAGNLQGAA